MVSGEHIRLDRTANGFTLTDLSSNGTFVNGERVSSCTLSASDTVQLGPGGPTLRVAPLTVRVEPAPAPTTQAGVLGEKRLPRIIVERLSSTERHEFSQAVIRIGRDPSSDISFDAHAELAVSVQHAKISVLDGQAILFDLDSTNGTFVDGEKIARHVLSGGERILLGTGGPELRVQIVQDTAPLKQGATQALTPETLMAAASSPLRSLSLGEAELIGRFAVEETLSIGRDAACDITLDSLYVSHRHAEIERTAQGVTLRDLGSANGTFLNGQRVSEAETLEVGHEFVVGPFQLKWGSDEVLLFDTSSRTWVEAKNLFCTDKKTGDRYLDSVSMHVEPGEFVCLLGPSGSGKSTLLKSMSGFSPASGGTVELNNIDFYSHYDQLKQQVGYVPQEDIIHPQLTVESTLNYAAQLRLPRGTNRVARDESVTDVLSLLELSDHRHKSIQTLSGGQRKRVSIAVELLTAPSVIYLDEPTSGLDPSLEEKLMVLLRELTSRGKSVVTVTHTLDHVHLADKVGVLSAGRLVFFGSPDDACTFFNVASVADLFKGLEGKPSGELAERFERSRKISTQTLTEGSDDQRMKGSRRTRRLAPNWISEFVVLSRRYVELVTRDTRNTAILLLQAPIIALLAILASQSDRPANGPTSTLLLMLSLSALWFGCSNAARELTKERNVFRRERMVNLRVFPYVLSKFFVLQWLGLVQVAVMLTLVVAFRGGHVVDPPAICQKWSILACSQLILPGLPGSFASHLLNLYLTSLCGIGLGLLVSALVDNSDKAVSLLPLILIPQVLFSGSFGLPSPEQPLKRAVGYAMVLNWSFDQAKRITMCMPTEEQGPEGCSSCLHTWDPYKYRRIGSTAQTVDGRCASLTGAVGDQIVDAPESLTVIEDGLYTDRASHDTGPARLAHRSWRGLWVQASWVLPLFAAICIVVRRRR